MGGRARGRSRGRARGGTEGGPQPDQRPGGPPAAAAPPSVAAAPPAAQPPPGNGRAAHRGGPRGAEPRPGGDVAQTTEQMQQLSMAGGEPGTRGRKRGGILVQEPTTRPAHITDKKGTSGSPITLITNTFKLETKPNFVMFQYHVEFNPDVQNSNLRRRLIKDHKEMIGYPMAFDGSILFLPKKLESSPIEVYSQLPRDQTNIRITIKLTNELPPTSFTCIQMYNVIFRRVLAMLEMKQIGRHYYSPSQGVTIPQHKLEVWPGFITSILKYETDVMLMADISHKILRTNTVLDTMYELYNQVRSGFHDMCAKKLLGEIVLTRYNNKTYRIDDIDWEKNPKSTFTLHNGTETSFMEYYQKHHNMTVNDMDQPLLVSKPKKKDERRGMSGPILLLPELCTLTGLSDETRADFHVMKDIAIHTRVPPDGRHKTLQGFIDRIATHEEVQKEMSGWGLRFAKTLLQIQSRVLPPEKIHQQTSFNYKPSDADWSREMRGAKLLNCVSLKNWCLLVTRRDSPKAQDFIQTLSRVGPPMGIMVDRPSLLELPDDNTQTYLRALKDQVNPDTQMAVCILPTNKKDRYDAIKKNCCVHHPVPSQVIVGRTLAKKQMLMSVATKIAIQLNCKMGGEVWAVEIPLKNMMVIGIDCYHDSASKGRSVGAFIASTNKTLTRFYSRVTFQHNHQELMDGLTSNLTASLRKYHELNKALPERIVIYRDGVGDGQLPMVVGHEIPQLTDCFKEVGGDYKPRLAFVVVKKRINMRFFASQGRGLSNPPPGTCIDKDVTRPEWYDFFLVSQAVRQGTVTPTHYNVVYDQSGMKPDHMQRLTYKLCHLYYNWPGTVRVPAPCQYAHKLAFLVGQSLHTDPDIALSDKLFFL